MGVLGKRPIQKQAQNGFEVKERPYHRPQEKALQCVLKRAGPGLYNEHFQGLTRPARRAESYNAHSLSEEGNEGTTYKSYGDPYLSSEAALPLVFPVLSEGSCRRRIGALRGRRSVLSRRSGDLNPARLVPSRTTLTGRWQVVESLAEYQGRSEAKPPQSPVFPALWAQMAAARGLWADPDRIRPRSPRQAEYSLTS